MHFDLNDDQPMASPTDTSMMSAVPQISAPPIPHLDLEAPTGRGHRARRPTKKAIYMMPQGPRQLVTPPPEPPVDEDPLNANTASATSVTSVSNPPAAPRRVILRVTEIFKTAPNDFGLWREYRGKPAFVCDIPGMQAPTTNDQASKEPNTRVMTQAEAVRDIIHPFPNISLFRFAHLTSLYSGTSVNFSTAMQKFLFMAPDFNARDAAAVDLGTMKDKVAEMNKPWNKDSEGWTKQPIFIRVPNASKQTKANRRQQAPSAETEGLSEIEGSRICDSEGVPFRVDNFWRRGLMPVIERVFSKDPSAKEFHYEPFRQMFRRPGSTDPPIEVYGELYMSKEWIKEHEKIQKLNLSEHGIENDGHPRAIAALQFWSDATHLTDFGQAKAWSIYLASENQSKYDRDQRSRHAMHHIGYLPSVSSYYLSVRSD